MRRAATMLFGVPALLWTLVCGPGLAAQQRPTFRTSTAVVEVEAIVLDAHGQFVHGLGADDFTLYEDGKPQRIDQFYVVSDDHVVRASQLEADAAGRPAEKAHRVFVLMFDEGHLSTESLMRMQRGAADFILEQIGPGDVAGVLVNGDLYRHELTTDKGAVLAAIRSARPRVENRHTLLAAFREFPRIPSEHDALRIAEGARELLERLTTEACRTSAFDCEAAGGMDEVQTTLQNKARYYVRAARTLTDQTVAGLTTLAANLGRFPGRKTIVLLSDGFFIEDARGAIERVAARAARAGVTIYSIDGRGLRTTTGTPDALTTGPSRSTLFDTGEDGPAILTAGTGGLTMRNIGDLPGAFEIVARDTSTYYVLGYSPANAALDGKFRRIEVKSSIAGARVRARKGYMATPLPPQERIWK